MISAGKISASDIQQVAGSLCNFFTELPPLIVRPCDYRRRLEVHIRQYRDGLPASNIDLDHSAIRRIHEAQLLLLRLSPKLLDHRVLDGRIVEGHGDLRPEHIYLSPAPTIIDCVELNSEFRQLDALDELCYLAMECERLNSAWIGDQIISTYRSTSGDTFPEQLAAFYKSYRACVRAKVCILRTEQLLGEAKTRSVQLAAE